MISWSSRLCVFLAVAGVLGNGCSDRAKQERHLSRAEGYFKAGELEKAKIEYLTVLRYQRTNVTAIVRLGNIFFDQGAAQQALPFLVAARQLNPDELSCRLKLGQIFLVGKDYAKSRQEAVAILAKAPGNDEAIQLLAHSSQTLPDVQDAQNRLEQLRQQSGDRAAIRLASAELLFRTGNPTAGEAALGQALALDSKSYSAHIAMGNLLLSRTNIVQAEAEFRLAAELAPVRSGARTRYAEFKLQTGKRDEAKQILQDLLAKAPDHLPPRRLLGQIALAERKFDDAQKSAELVLQIDPGDLEGRVLLADVQLAKGQPGKAVEILENLEKAFPRSPEVKYLLARSCVADKKSTRAAGLLDQAIAMKPDYPEAILLNANVQLQNGDAAKATAALQGLVKQRPDLAPAQLQLAEAFLAMGRSDEAVAIYQRLTQTNPKDGQGWYTLGAALRQKGQRTEARAAFDKAAELAPESVAPVAQLIELDLEEKNYDQALSRLHPAGQPPRPGSNALLLEARIHSARADWTQAENVLQKVIATDPGATSAYYLLATVYSESKRQDQAISQLETLLSKNPKEQRALMLLGILASEKQEYTKSRDAYEQLLSASPNFVPALNNLAYLYSEKLAQLPKAYELAQKARTLVPDDPSIADTLGWILFQQKKYNEALPLIKESAAKMRDNAEVQFHLGMAYSMLGQEQPARAALQQALKLGGTFAGKEEAQRRLAVLDGTAGNSGGATSAELEQIVRDHPEDLTARTRLAERYERENTPDKAIQAYLGVISVNPKAASAHLKLALLYSATTTNKVKATEFAKKAWELSPGNSDAAAILGRLVFENREFPYAYSLLRESLKGLSSRADVHYDFAWAAYSMGRETESTQAMQRALDLNTNLPTANNARWFLLLVAATQDPKSLPEADRKVADLLKVDPANVPALVLLAHLQTKRGESKSAIQSYERVLAAFPDFFPAKKQLAMLYSQESSQEARASELALKARESLPEDAELSGLLGKINFKRKNYSAALLYLQEGAAHRPNDPELLYYLGMTHYQNQDKAKCKQTLDRAVLAGLKEPLLQDARRVLSEVQAP